MSAPQMAVSHRVRGATSPGSRVAESGAVATRPEKTNPTPSPAVSTDARAARIASAAADFGATAVKSATTDVYRHHPELLYCSASPVHQLEKQMRDLEARGQPVGLQEQQRLRQLGWLCQCLGAQWQPTWSPVWVNTWSPIEVKRRSEARRKAQTRAILALMRAAKRLGRSGEQVDIPGALRIVLGHLTATAPPSMGEPYPYGPCVPLACADLRSAMCVCKCLTLSSLRIGGLVAHRPPCCFVRCALASAVGSRGLLSQADRQGLWAALTARPHGPIQADHPVPEGPLRRAAQAWLQDQCWPAGSSSLAQTLEVDDEMRRLKRYHSEPPALDWPIAKGTRVAVHYIAYGRQGGGSRSWPRSSPHANPTPQPSPSPSPQPGPRRPGWPPRRSRRASSATTGRTAPLSPC